MTGEEEDVWGQYASTVQRLNEKKPEPVPAKKKQKPIQKIETAAVVELPTPPVVSPAPLWKKEPLDVRVERNLSLGDVFIEAKLDLHGQTEQAAYEQLQEFIAKQTLRGKRLVLVITGRGKDGESVLRANLPRWCSVAPLDSIVHAVRTAAPQHGGDGAFYVLLRKKQG